MANPCFAWSIVDHFHGVERCAAERFEKFSTPVKADSPNICSQIDRLPQALGCGLQASGLLRVIADADRWARGVRSTRRIRRTRLWSPDRPNVGRPSTTIVAICTAATTQSSGLTPTTAISAPEIATQIGAATSEPK